MKTDIPFNAVIKTLLFGKVPDLVIQRTTLCLLLGLILTGHSLVTTHILYQIFIKCQQKNVLILCGTKMDIARIMSN